MPRKLTQDKFVSRASEIHENKFDYSLVDYVNTRTKVKIVCPIHGIFLQMPYLHLRGIGCSNILCSSNKQKQTFVKKYGVENPSQCNKVKEKKKQTTIKNYGVEYPIQSAEVCSRIRQTNRARYGADHHWRNKNVQEKRKQTFLKRYGCGTPLLSQYVREKRRQTILQRYGVENLQQSKQVRDKTKQTNLRRYGGESPQQSKQVRDKTKQTNLRRYGVENPSQKHIPPHVLHALMNKQWLLDQHYTCKKSMMQISLEQGVTDATVGKYVHKHGIKVKQVCRHSYKAINWLEMLMKEQNIFIQHAQNIGEYRIPNTRLYVDGYCQDTNTVYEFYGDLYHGNPKLYPSDYLTFMGKTAAELYNITLQREKCIKQLGYNLITMWESHLSLSQ